MNSAVLALCSGLQIKSPLVDVLVGVLVLNIQCRKRYIVRHDSYAYHNARLGLLHAWFGGIYFTPC
jgi:hypothetical protein